MITTLVAIILSALYTPIRPPEPPAPFPYDPATVNYEVIEFFWVVPSDKTITFDRIIVEPDGQTPTLTCNTTWITISAPVVTADTDDPVDPAVPNSGMSRVYTYTCVFDPPDDLPPGIYSFDFTGTDNDLQSPEKDNRSIVIRWKWPKNRPPVIR